MRNALWAAFLVLVLAAGGLEALGAKHQVCPVREIVVDEENKIVSTPAYMLGQNISEVADGIEKTVAAVLKMVEG